MSWETPNLTAKRREGAFNENQDAAARKGADQLVIEGKGRERVKAVDTVSAT